MPSWATGAQARWGKCGRRADLNGDTMHSRITCTPYNAPGNRPGQPYIHISDIGEGGGLNSAKHGLPRDNKHTLLDARGGNNSRVHGNKACTGACAEDARTLRSQDYSAFAGARGAPAVADRRLLVFWPLDRVQPYQPGFLLCRLRAVDLRYHRVNHLSSAAPLTPW